ncbi:hypothetical protein MKZ38_001314 [Zalerion maritima]|uniref:Secreted protein n=1 Tax=Zalerion maritima TaxID=339359 RepID=A0AAD5RRZ2_9PEZI|nr:hypothetical protein MKZ38_001314 [Zalerion maritima]
MLRMLLVAWGMLLFRLSLAAPNDFPPLVGMWKKTQHIQLLECLLNWIPDPTAVGVSIGGVGGTVGRGKCGCTRVRDHATNYSALVLDDILHQLHRITTSYTKVTVMLTEVPALAIQGPHRSLV